MIALILVAVYLVVYRASRPVNASGSPPSFVGRVVRYSAILTIVLFVYAYAQSSKEPYVDYHAIGWLGAIQELNMAYARGGNPNRIPEPGK